MCKDEPNKHLTGEQESRLLEDIALVDSLRRLRDLADEVTDTRDQLHIAAPREVLVIYEETTVQEELVSLRAVIREYDTQDPTQVIAEHTTHTVLVDRVAVGIRRTPPREANASEFGTHTSVQQPQENQQG